MDLEVFRHDPSWFSVPGREDLDTERYEAWLERLSNSELEAENKATLTQAKQLLASMPAEPMPGRNDPCPCGSGCKFKKCCGR